MNKGFTLIELLVVVLIIGILAAIALPQYMKAVERARSAEAIQRLGDMATAMQVYFMQHDAFPAPANLADMDITFGDGTAAGLNTDAYDITLGNANGVVTAVRNGGNYQGATLTLTVARNGSVTKACAEGAGNGGSGNFCPLVASAGYATANP